MQGSQRSGVWWGVFWFGVFFLQVGCQYSFHLEREEVAQDGAQVCPAQGVSMQTAAEAAASHAGLQPATFHHPYC